MKIKLYYNNNIKNIDFNEYMQIGFLQEKILQYFSLKIINIEYCELFINNSKYIIGDINCSLNMPLRNILSGNDNVRIMIYDSKKNKNILKQPIINLFENIFKVPEIHNYLSFSDEILNNIENIYYDNIINEQSNNKIVLNDEQFNNIENICYNNIIDNCLICTENFNINDLIKKTKCNHIFHTKCIKQWLCKESNKCPICRTQI